MTYTQTGSYAAIAGLVVLLLNRFHIPVVESDIVTIISAIVTIAGIIKQFRAHKALAQSAGVYAR